MGGTVPDELTTAASSLAAEALRGAFRTLPQLDNGTSTHGMKVFVARFVPVIVASVVPVLRRLPVPPLHRHGWRLVVPAVTSSG